MVSEGPMGRDQLTGALHKEFGKGLFRNTWINVRVHLSKEVIQWVWLILSRDTAPLHKAEKWVFVQGYI